MLFRVAEPRRGAVTSTYCRVSPSKRKHISRGVGRRHTPGQIICYQSFANGTAVRNVYPAHTPNQPKFLAFTAVFSSSQNRLRPHGNQLFHCLAEFYLNFFLLHDCLFTASSPFLCLCVKFFSLSVCLFASPFFSHSSFLFSFPSFHILLDLCTLWLSTFHNCVRKQYYPVIELALTLKKQDKSLKKRAMNNEGRIANSLAISFQSEVCHGFASLTSPSAHCRAMRALICNNVQI